jgi:hypothetical protein
VRLQDRKDRQRSVADLITPMRERLARIPGITVTNIGVTDMGGSKSISFSLQGPDLAELERLGRQVLDRMQAIPGLVDLDSTLKPDKPTVRVDIKRDAAADLGLNVSALANTLRPLLAGISVGNWRASDGENYDVRLRLAPGNRDESGRPVQPAAGGGQQCRRHAARRAPVAGGRGEKRHRPQPDQPARPEPRDQHRRQPAGPQRRRGHGRHPRRAGRHRASRPATATPSAAAPRTCRSPSPTRWVRWRWQLSSST